MQHRSNEASQRVETIPGIGVIGATAIVATVADPTIFRSGRDFAAWIGLVPRQDRLGASGSSADLQAGRPLLAAHSCRRGHCRVAALPGESWEVSLAHNSSPATFKVVAVALANKMARTAWALLAHGGTITGA